MLWRQNHAVLVGRILLPVHVLAHRDRRTHNQNKQQLLTAATGPCRRGVAAVTAARGRGKSALAGQLISRIAGSAIVTAPAKAATDVLAQFAGEQVSLYCRRMPC